MHSYSGMGSEPSCTCRYYQGMHMYMYNVHVHVFMLFNPLPHFSRRSIYPVSYCFIGWGFLGCLTPSLILNLFASMLYTCFHVHCTCHTRFVMVYVQVLHIHCLHPPLLTLFLLLVPFLPCSLAPSSPPPLPLLSHPFRVTPLTRSGHPSLQCTEGSLH